jgi:hypothetical protein
VEPELFFFIIVTILINTDIVFYLIVGEQMSSRRPEDFLCMFGMDLVDFDVKKNKKIIIIFFGMESTNMQFFQKKICLEFFSVLRNFYGQTFFLHPRWRFSHFKISLYSKNPLQSTTNTKKEVSMDLHRIYTQKKLSIGLKVEKFNMAPKIKMAVNLEFLLKFYSHSMVYAWIYSLHSFKQKKKI